MAVAFDSWSLLIGGPNGFYEKIARGAFDESLASGRGIICTVNHDPAMILGRTSAGTLKLIPSDRGIAFEVIAPDVSYARDLEVSIGRRDVAGCSFIFDDKPGGVEWAEHNGKRSRIVTKAELYEVSFVTLPAYEATTASVGSGAERSAEGGWLTDLEMRMMIEQACRD
jgi:HK97 family phage prohead protease